MFLAVIQRFLGPEPRRTIESFSQPEWLQLLFNATYFWRLFLSILRTNSLTERCRLTLFLRYVPPVNMVDFLNGSCWLAPCSHLWRAHMFKVVPSCFFMAFFISNLLCSLELNKSPGWWMVFGTIYG